MIICAESRELHSTFEVIGVLLLKGYSNAYKWEISKFTMFSHSFSFNTVLHTGS